MGTADPMGQEDPMDSSGVWQVMIQNMVLQSCFCPNQRQGKPKIMISLLIHLYQAPGSANSLEFSLRKRAFYHTGESALN